MASHVSTIDALLTLVGEPGKTPQVIEVLSQSPVLASSQDAHGYSLLHAAASYNCLDLLRTLLNDYAVNVNLKDEDGETALFVTESIETAKILVEEFHIDITIRGVDGQTARERIVEEDTFPEVAVYLRVKELEASGSGDGTEASHNVGGPPPLVPEGVQVNFGTMDPAEVAEETVDPEVRRRIEELASRDDFQEETGQAALRELITGEIRKMEQTEETRLHEQRSGKRRG